MPEIIRNGVRLSYQEAGTGGPPLLFVHGFGGSAQHFSAQLEYFKRSRRAVAIDRRGHGQSDKPEGPYDIPAIAEEVIWTSRELGLHRPVLVVHSMGAIGLEVTNQAPELLSALVILDAPALPPPEVREAFQQLAKGLRSEAYESVIAQTCDQLIFLPTDDAERRKALHAGILQTPQRILAATWEQFLAYDPVPAASRCRLPLLYVNAVMPFNEAKMRELCPQLNVGRTVGSGHMHQLEVPDQVNAMLDRFLQLHAPPR
jgi:pimeloyl-ACP methyl ester carboxylesterase